MRRLPPVGSIQAFVAIARRGSLKAAAEQLALSSPALTRRIQSLEQFLGVALFDRLHGGLQLSRRGEQFFADVAPHIDAMAIAVESISESGTEMRIRVAIPSLFAAQRLVPALTSLRQRHPQLRVDIDTGANRLARLDDDVDAVIAITESVGSQYYARKLEHGRVVTIGARRFIEGAEAVRDPADIARVPILLHRDMPNIFDEWRRAVGLPDLVPAATSTYDAGQLILDAAAEGLGIAFMHESHFSHSSDERLVRIFPETIRSPYAYWFVCAPGALQRRPVRAFHDWLFDHFAALEAEAEAEAA